MLLKNMKNSKVIENNLIFLLAFLFCCPLQALTNPVSFCSKKLTSLECINGHITLRYPDPEAEDIFFLEGQFIYDEKEYSFSTRRPVFSMESCFDTMEKIKFITSSGQFCVQAEDRFEDDDYVTLEGFFSSKGKWTGPILKTMRHLIMKIILNPSVPVWTWRKRGITLMLF